MKQTAGRLIRRHAKDREPWRGHNPDADADRPWRKIYGTAKWKKLRKQVIREQPICKFCPRPSSHVDHIQDLATHPHLAYTRSNLRGLCMPCHNKRTSNSSRHKSPFAKDKPASAGFGADGLPLDKDNPFNR